MGARLEKGIEIRLPQQSTLDQEERRDDCVVGQFVGFSADAEVRVTLPGLTEPGKSVGARSIVSLGENDVGCAVVIAFEDCQSDRPLILGRVRESVTELRPDPLNIDLDSKRLELTAQDEIVLRCGKASITLSKSGKIVIRGTSLLSRSSGPNRIKGGSVQLN